MCATASGRATPVEEGGKASEAAEHNRQGSGESIGDLPSRRRGESPSPSAGAHAVCGARAAVRARLPVAHAYSAWLQAREIAES